LQTANSEDGENACKGGAEKINYQFYSVLKWARFAILLTSSSQNYVYYNMLECLGNFRTYYVKKIGNETFDVFHVPIRAIPITSIAATGTSNV